MGSQPLFVGQLTDICRNVRERFARELDHTSASQKRIRRQTCRPTRRTASRQHMRRPSGIVADRNRTVFPQKGRARIANLVAQLSRITASDMQMLGGDQVGDLARLLCIAYQQKRPKRVQAIQTQFTTTQFTHLNSQLLLNRVDQPLVPGDQQTRSRRMFRLSQHVSRRKGRIRRLVSDHNHFAGPSNRIDIDIAIHELFGQSHEQAARSDDLVDRWQPVDSVSQRGDRLRATDRVHFADAQFVTSRQHVRIVSTEFCWRRNHGDLLHTGRLSGHHGHQHS